MKVESLKDIQNVALKSCACPRGFRKHLGSHFHCRLCETTSRYSHRILQHEYEVHQNAALNDGSLVVETVVNVSKATTPSAACIQDSAVVESTPVDNNADDVDMRKCATDEILSPVASVMKTEGPGDHDNGESTQAEAYCYVYHDP